MHYEINISLNGKHFFATHERSLKTKAEYEKVCKVLEEKFPETEGYEISCTLWESKGSRLPSNMEKF